MADGKDDKKEEKKEKKAAKAPSVIKRRRKKGPVPVAKTPQVFPSSKCKLRLLKLERIKDFLLMEQEFIQNQWVSQGTIAPYNRSLPSSARSHGSNATSFSSASEGMQHAGKSKDRRSRIGRVGTKQDPNRNLPRLSNLPAGVNIDGGRVSPILSVVSDVDALNRSEASPVGFHVDIKPGPNRVRDKSPGPLRAPHAPKQPPYDAQQAVNLLRLERSSRTSRGGSLRSYWKWGGDKVGGGVAAGRGDAGGAVVKPKASRVETEAERIAAVRKMQLMYMENTKAKMIAGGEATEISQAVDMSLYTAMGNAGASMRWKAGGTMTDSISSFPATPDSRVPTTTSTGATERGFMAPISGPLKPKTPNIRDIHLSDDDLMLVSKYFNQGLSADQRVMDGSDNDEDEHQALEASALANMERGSLPREGSRASISSDDLPGTAGTEHGLLQWTSNLDMEAIENL